MTWSNRPTSTAQQYFVDQLGLPKAMALEETLGRINPYVAIEARALRRPASIPDLFR
ncbi:MAG: hypothetical protein R2864_06765 [Syntrophotaleaceae bacterium]